MAEHKARSLKEVGKRLLNFLSTLVVLALVIGAVVLVMTLKAYIPALPIPSIVLLLGSIGIYLYTLYSLVTKKTVWYLWLILLLCLGLAGYWWETYWGIAAGVGIWIVGLLIGALVLRLFSPKSSESPHQDGRSDQISTVMGVNGPEGEAGWIDLSRLFYRAEQVQDTDALLAQGNAVESIRGFMRELRKWADSGFIGKDAPMAAAEKLGIAHLLKADEPPAEEGIPENFWDELESLDDIPR